ncbi:MAG: murein L,D-transpeptidase family protein [Chthoniobacterales bacterium]
MKTRQTEKKTIDQLTEEPEVSVPDKTHNIDDLTDGSPLAILAFKEERMLELWKKRVAGWEYIRSYPDTGYSGKTGPQLKEGDLQSPEGEYPVEYLNPNSSYHLSMKINYPNEFDKEMAAADGRTGLGFDIFIHGSNQTVGCIPIGNKNIEELYNIVEKNGYQQTQILIAPRDFREGKSAPVIEGIEWEDELYETLSERLHDFPKESPSR